jgi:autotransporter-associated beta strand protein
MIGSLTGDALTTVHLGNGTLTLQGIGSPTTFSGSMDGMGGGLSCTGGSLTLLGSITYTGATNLSNTAQLHSGGNNALATTSDYTLSGSSILDLQSNDQTIGSLSSASPGTAVHLGAGTLITGGSGLNTTFAGTLDGVGGALTYVGSGSLTLTGVSTYTGPTTVESGTFIVNGSLQSIATVLSGGVLKGKGTLGGAVIQAGGTIQAGQSIGQITLGSLTLVPSANLVLEIAPGQNNCSSYLVNGDVHLGGSTLNIIADGPISNFVLTDSYTFITASSISLNPIDGTFGVVNFPTGLQGTIDYSNADLVILRLTGVAPPPNPPVPPTPPPIPPNSGDGGFNGNAKKLRNYLNQFLAVPALRSIFLDLSHITPNQLQAALDSISSSRNAAANYFANLLFFRMNDLSLQRLKEGRTIQRRNIQSPSQIAALDERSHTLLAQNSGQKNMPAKELVPAGKARTLAAQIARHGFWVAGFGERISQQGMHQNPNIRDTAYGGAIGYEAYGPQNGIFSIAAGYIRNDISENHSSGSGHSQGANVEIYGTGFIGKGYIEGGIAAGWNSFHMHRKIDVPGPTPFHATAKSSFKIWQIMPHLGGGYDWMMKWGVIEPFVVVDCVGSRQTAYTETGAYPLNMHVKRQEPCMLRSQCGVNFYETWERASYLVIFEQSASYVNKLPFQMNVWTSLAIAPMVSSAPDSIGLSSYDEMLNLGGISAEIFYKHKRSGLFISATYYGEFGSSYRSNDLTATLGVFF